MASLIEIGQGWYNFIKGDSNTKQLMHVRLSVCDTCPSKKQLTPAGKVIIELLNKDGSIFMCKECGCPLSAKSANPESKCPLNKWPKLNTESYY
jgi:rubrerythrin